jgi:ABC-2 type transport system ATP-binding protein
MKDTINVLNILKKYGSKKALGKLSFRLSSGNILGVVGINGAGKTTLINTLCGLIPLDDGEIYYFGKRYHLNDLNMKGQMGILTERAGLYEELKGQEHLYLIARLYGLSKDVAISRTIELIDFMELTEVKDEFIKHYSTGMKKKLAVATVIIHQPRILLLDEPFENIDPVSRRSIVKVLRKMAHCGATIMLTSHIIASIEELCDQVCILHKGCKVVHDKTDMVKEYLVKKFNSPSLSNMENLFIELMKDKVRNKELSFI